MSRMDEQHTLPEPATHAPFSAPSAGQWLRQTRERAGVDLGVLSALLKVPVRQLQALEADQHDQLMGTAFVRGLTVAVCRHLHVDPQPALDLLPGNVTRLGPEKDSLGGADVPPLGGLFHGRHLAWHKWLSWAVAALLVMGGVYWGGRSKAPEEVSVQVPAPATESVSQGVVVPAVGELGAAPAAGAAAPASASAPVTLPLTVTLPAAPAAASSTETKSQ